MPDREVGTTVYDGQRPVVPSTPDAFVRRLCQIGDTVHYKRSEGASHFTVVKASWTDLLAWLEDRIDGRAAPSICRTGAG